MRTEYLNYLLEIERCSSINKAADNLFISRTTLISMVNSVEKELGYEIFTRTSNGTFPTPAGQKMLKEAKKIAPIISGWYHYGESVPGKYTVKLAFSNLVLKLIMTNIQLFFQKKYPNVLLNYKEALYFTVPEITKTLHTFEPFILAGVIDVKEINSLLRFLPAVGYNYIPLASIPIKLFLSIESPLAQQENICVKDLAQLPYIISPANLQDMLCQNTDFCALKNISVFQKGLINNEKTLNMVAKNEATLLTCLISKNLLSPAICIKPIRDLDLSLHYFLLIQQKNCLKNYEQDLIDLVISLINSELF